MDGENPISLRRYWQPRYWPLWLLLGLIRLAARGPLAPQVRIMRKIGWVLGLAKHRTYRIAQRNLELCFPDLSAHERRRLLKAHFESLGASLPETAAGWFAPLEKLRALIRVEGAEHLHEALASGRGVILYSAHFTMLELGAAILGDVCRDYCAMYHPPANGLLDAIMRRGRGRFVKELIPRDNVRALLRNLKAGAVVVYLPDQTHVGSQSSLLPFFGEMAVTNTATSKLARLSGAVVIPYFFRRLPGDASYVVNIGPAIADFPTEDPREDTLRLVQRLEDYVRLAPEQYLWTYKKFRGRPATYPDAYAGLSRPLGNVRPRTGA
jgi:KDO2-lipid IV(A) lauroyltransferase